MLRKSLAIHLIALAAMLACHYAMLNTVFCDPILCPYTDRFMAEAKKRNVTLQPFYLLNVSFADTLEDNAVGVSYYSLSPRNKSIEISKRDWHTFSEEQKIMLIAHEMGHAVLHRKHIETGMLDGSALSIMYPTVLPTDSIKRNGEYYWNELFSIQGDL